MKKCGLCKQEKEDIEFYKKMEGNLFPYCISCERNRVKNRLRSIKDLCLEYKGNKCVICGYNKCRGALEFHH